MGWNEHPMRSYWLWLQRKPNQGLSKSKTKYFRAILPNGFLCDHYEWQITNCQFCNFNGFISCEYQLRISKDLLYFFWQGDEMIEVRAEKIKKVHLSVKTYSVQDAQKITLTHVLCNCRRTHWPVNIAYATLSHK